MKKGKERIRISFLLSVFFRLLEPLCVAVIVLPSEEHPEIKANGYTFSAIRAFFVLENKNNDYCYGRNATVHLWLDFILV